MSDGNGRDRKSAFIQFILLVLPRVCPPLQMFILRFRIQNERKISHDVVSRPGVTSYYIFLVYEVYISRRVKRGRTRYGF